MEPKGRKPSKKKKEKEEEAPVQEPEIREAPNSVEDQELLEQLEKLPEHAEPEEAKKVVQVCSRMTDEEVKRIDALMKYYNAAGGDIPSRSELIRTAIQGLWEAVRFDLDERRHGGRG